MATALLDASTWEPLAEAVERVGAAESVDEALQASRAAAVALVVAQVPGQVPLPFG